MKTCRECGGSVASNAAACPQCGRKLNAGRPIELVGWALFLMSIGACAIGETTGAGVLFGIAFACTVVARLLSHAAS